MATDTAGKLRAGSTGMASHPLASIELAGGMVLKVLASLKLTVALLALSLILVLFGTLAQARKDMWDVIADYFDAWFAVVHFEDLLPPAWFPKAKVSGGFRFVGGKLIGCVMMLNLVAAHMVRFTAQARGRKLAVGLAAMAAGLALTTAVIVSGHSRGGLQGKPPFEWSTLWWLLRIAMLGAGGACIYGLISLPRERRAERTLLWTGSALVLANIFVVFLPGSDEFLGDAGMRILWQLLQASFAGGVLLAGCIVVFGKRGGVVLLHGGIGLLMFGQLLVNLFAIEERMTIREGETVNFVQDIRGLELAVVATSEGAEDEVFAIPLTEKGKSTRFVNVGRAKAEESQLPFDIEVVKFLKNSSSLRDLKPGETCLATAGVGLTYAVDEIAQNTGADSSGAVDVAAAYVKFVEKASGKDLGTYLFSQVLTEQNHVEKVAVDGKTYEASLRFKRTYKPYSIALKDVRKDDYPGTTIPKNYSSDIQLTDPSRDFDDAIHIRMNEPLRYAGETFYQSGYRLDADGAEVTDLQVVTNTGWMIPYVACMLVVIGMLYHFGVTLVRFLKRVTGSDSAAAAISTDIAAEGPHSAGRGRHGRDRAAKHEAGHPSVTSSNPFADRSGSAVNARRPVDLAVSAVDTRPAWRRWAMPVSIALSFLFIVAYMSRNAKPTPPSNAKSSTEGFDLTRFGQLPVLEKGRVKPLDTLARNTLRVISNRETFLDATGKSQPAIRWLIDTITEKAPPSKPASSSENEPEIVANDYRVFRIENEDVLNLLGLERRKGFRYSVNELLAKIQAFDTKVEEAKARKAEDLTTYERKLIELDGRIRTFTLIKASFTPLSLPPLPTEEQFNANPERARAQLERIKRGLMQIPEADRQLVRMQPPRAVPFKREDGEWQPYSTAWNFDYLQRTLGQRQEPDEAVEAFTSVLVAYGNDNPREFNAALGNYESVLRRLRPELYNASLVSAESRFNKLAPFSWTAYTYVLAFALTAVAWLLWAIGWHRPVNRFAFWIIVCTLVVHTGALAARVVISGRPPVTNLYSSAVFIGWGCVIFGVVLERLLKMGVGNIVASSAGFVTLVIADKLAMDGETMAVMQAVLDTQFWLSTHVVCITLGYSATFVAGLLGIVYLFARFAPGALEAVVSKRQGAPLSLGKALGTMMYGVTCFAVFFSFWGTVLGGLWADDSWGRFWGWDPKENGALMIVIWNAIMLHALWDRMVGDRGLAMLAVGGNIVTSWSWFGVNELGVGLHSYGFTDGVLLALSLTMLAHLLVIASGFIPPFLRRHREPMAATMA
ncbi:MAG: cytochrome c biogenesis protein CcsA [Planctomycetota bacterium]